MTRMKNKDHLKAKQIVEEFTQIHGQEALEKYANRGKPEIDFTADLFDRQIEIINHASKRKAVLAARRSGKSHGLAYYLVKTCVENRNANCAFIGITQRSAKDIIWKYIEDINNRYSLQGKESLTQNTWTFPNGSSITITGADNPKEIRKHLGKHYNLAVIDECGEFGPHLEQLVTKILVPTMIDVNGTLVMAGTPGDVCGGFWYKVSTGKIAAWRVFDNWNLTHNPKLPAWRGKKEWKTQANEVLEQIKVEEGYDNDSPQYIRQYLGRWAEGGSSLIYGHFIYERNTFRVLPEKQQWTNILSVDFGTTDSSAIIAGSYSQYINNLYIVESYKQDRLPPEDLANIIKAYYDKYNPVAIIADGNGIGAAYIAQLNKMYELPIQLAEKKDKVAFVELMNDDFRQGRLKINESCTDLLKEINIYSWADIELKILPEIADDHCLDALLYLWRHALHWKSKPKPKVPVVGEPEYEDYLVEQEIERTMEWNEKPFWKRF